MPLILANLDHTDAIANTTNKLLPQQNAQINMLRFVAICSVLWGHCLLGLEHRVFVRYDYQVGQSILLQAGRIGTIIFFLISGYLISHKIQQFSVFGYLRYRLHSLIIPWLIFLVLLVVLQLFDALPLQQILHGPTKVTLLFAYNLLKGSIFHAAYWFIPVALISVVLLIVFKNLFNKLWFGLLLGSFMVFYGVNVYHGWVSANHTQAFLGYVFFVWLGAKLEMHAKLFQPLLEKLSWSVMLPILLILFLIACFEGITLTSIGCVDAYASLRHSNAVLSVVLFLCFFKTYTLDWVKYFHPRQNTYGIYLIHSIVISEFTPTINRLIEKHGLHNNLPYLFLIQVLFFTAVLFISLIVTASIRRCPLRFIVGARK